MNMNNIPTYQHIYVYVVKEKQRSFNFFVAPFKSYSLQLDQFHYSNTDIEATYEIKVGLVLIDLLSKYAVRVPIKKEHMF